MTGRLGKGWLKRGEKQACEPARTYLESEGEGERVMEVEVSTK